MAEKKTKKSKDKGGAAKETPEKFIKTKARKLPLGNCYLTESWENAGKAIAIVTRKRPSSNLVVACFNVDTRCTGVRDAFCRHNMSPEDFKTMILDRVNDLKEVDYAVVHNLILGAIEFAEEAGINPAPDYALARYVLEEDSEEIPLIEYDYGLFGQHYLEVGCDMRELRYFETLKKNLGNNFKFKILDSCRDDDFDDLHPDSSKQEKTDKASNLTAIKSDVSALLSDMNEEMDRYPEEPYTYRHPGYPSALDVKHPFIAEALLSPDNRYGISDEMIDRILALPAEEVADDLANIMLYEIGRTYNCLTKTDDDRDSNSALIMAMILLGAIGHHNALDAILEVMRQSVDFIDYHFDDFATELIYPALYACGQSDVEAIERYIYQPGLASYVRGMAITALAMIVFNNPERRGEIIEILRRLLCSLPTRLPKCEACDALFASCVIIGAMEINARELREEIERVFDTDCVDRSICGDYDSVIEELDNNWGAVDPEQYIVADPHEKMARLRQCAVY